MKYYLSLIILFCACTFASAQTAQTANQKFLNRFSELVKRIKPEFANEEDSVAAWRAERKNIQLLYKERYRNIFTDEEIEQYASLNGQYRSKMTDIHLSDLSEKMDTLGSKVERGVRRTSRRVSGFVKGLKKQSDQNRKKEE